VVDEFGGDVGDSDEEGKRLVGNLNSLGLGSGCGSAT